MKVIECLKKSLAVIDSKTCKLFFVGLTSFTLTLLSCLTAAAPLNLSSTPLVVSASVEPNFMVLFDTSSSMLYPAPSGEYDADDASSAWATAACSSGGNLLTTDINTSVLLTIRNGYPIINYNGDQYVWGTDSDSDFTIGGDTYPRACFNNTAKVRAFLIHDTFLISGTVIDPIYSGHYLNYYFGSLLDGSWPNAAAGAPFSAVIHPNQRRRIDVGQDTVKNIIDAQPSGLIKLGLSHFDDADRVRVDQPIALLTNGVKGSYRTTVDGYNANVIGTPIAESLYQLGRYFIGSSLPGASNQLTLHPDTTPQDVLHSSVFASDPAGLGGSWTSPITASCQKNFIIAMTDGQPSNDTNVSSYLRDYDGDCTDSGTCPGPYDMKNGTGYNYSVSPVSGNVNGSDYMDDVAQALFEVDLRPDLNGVNGEAVKNNILTYLIGFADESVKSDQLFVDTAVNGGTTQPYFPGTEVELLNTMNTIVNDALGRTGSVASVAFNASTLSTNSAVFQAQFNTARWSGSLFAFPLSDAGDIEAMEWDAGAKLDATVPASRKIITFNKDSLLADGITSARDGFTFEWDNLSASQRNDLLSSNIDADNDGNAPNDVDDALLLMDFLKGDRSNEGGLAKNFRVRAGRLGDIVNSTPVYVGIPQSNWPDYDINNKFGDTGTDQSYSDWKLSQASRTPVIYAGANDGMLHGFNAELGVNAATDGTELMAYIPGAIASTTASRGLHYLADKNYQHQFYVDLTPTVSDVFIDTGDGGGSQWHTVLIGGLGAGGRGLFALDVTDPSKYADPAANADDIVLWEFTNEDNPDIGYTYSQPTIAMMANGQWAAIFGNGYNSDDGFAKLFIVFIEAGVDGSLTGGDYVVIDTQVGDATTPNGLSTPRVVDLDDDKVADRIYAGDLRGNMWAFDVSSTNTSSWKVAYKSGSTPTPLFTAKDAFNNPQPITTAPILAKNPAVTDGGSNQPNLLVLFGTGKFLEGADRTASDIMTYYAVWDEGADQLTRTNLAARELVSGATNRTVSGNPVDWSNGGDHGWYIDLVHRTTAGGSGIAKGERIISESLLRREVLFFNSIIPDNVQCSAGGSGWLMSLDLASGLATPSEAVFDANNDGVIDNADLGFVGAFFDTGIPAKSGILGDNQYTPGSDGTIQRRLINVGASAKEGRLTWEQKFRANSF